MFGKRKALDMALCPTQQRQWGLRAGLFGKGSILTIRPPPLCPHPWQRSPWGSGAHLLGHQAAYLDGRWGGHRGALHLPGPGAGLEHTVGFTEIGRGGRAAVDQASPTEAPLPPQGKAARAKGLRTQKSSLQISATFSFVSAPSSPGSPDWGWHPRATAQRGGSGRQDWLEVVPGLTSLC